MNANPLEGHILAIDVGGTKILAAAFSTSGRCLTQTQVPTPASQGAAAVLAAMDRALAKVQMLVQRQLSTDGANPFALGLGVSAAGVIDSAQASVIDATDALPGWKGQNFRQHFAAQLKLPVHALNDVHAALLGELHWGALRGQASQSAVMLTLGTGLGGALMMQGQVQRGADQLTGHFGRCQMHFNGRWQPVESLLSGTGLANLYRAAGGDLLPGSGAREVVAHLGDAFAQPALDQWIELLAMQIHNLHWALNPQQLILGGGMLDARQHWWQLLMERLSDLHVPLRVVPAQLGNLAGAAGAARHLLDSIEQTA